MQGPPAPTNISGGGKRLECHVFSPNLFRWLVSAWAAQLQPALLQPMSLQPSRCLEDVKVTNGPGAAAPNCTSPCQGELLYNPINAG